MCSSDLSDFYRNIAGIQANGVSGVFSVTNNLRLDAEFPVIQATSASAAAAPSNLPSLKSPADRGYGWPKEGSVVVSGLLSDAKAQAVQLKRDALEMESFTRMNPSWSSHLAKAQEISGHINKMGEIVRVLQMNRRSASFW